MRRVKTNFKPARGELRTTREIVQLHREMVCNLMERHIKNADLSWTNGLPACPLQLEIVKVPTMAITDFTYRGMYTTSNGTSDKIKAGYKTCKNPNNENWRGSNMSQENIFHPGGYYEMRSTGWPTQPGNQCIYDNCCKLMLTIPAAGTADKSSPRCPISAVVHYNKDVVPYNWAVELDKCFPNLTPSYVSRYYERRPFIAEEEKCDE